MVSNFSTIAMTSAGLLVISLVSGSRRADRCCVFGACVLETDVVFRIDLSASLVFFTNIVRRAAPLLAYLRRFACWIVSLVATLCSL